MLPASAERPTCAGCGEPIGVYEPLWRVAPSIGAERTSWLNLAPDARRRRETLWHASCAENTGVEGG